MPQVTTIKHREREIDTFLMRTHVDGDSAGQEKERISRIPRDARQKEKVVEKGKGVSRSRNSRIRCAKAKPDGQTESPLIHAGFLQAAIFCGRRNVVRIVGCQRNGFKENARSPSENMKLFG